MNQESTHYWVVGPTRAIREADYPQLGTKETIHVNCHRGLYGPYSGASELMRTLSEKMAERSPELFERHSLVMLMVAPELNKNVNGTENLTTLAEGDERTRFFSHHRTPRIAHGLIDFLIELAEDAHMGPFAIVFENVHEADGLDQEWLRLLLRRARPERLVLLLASQEDGIREDLREALGRYAVRVDAQGEVQALAEVEEQLATLSAEEREGLGREFVQSDGTSDHLPKRIAYETAEADVRARWHDERAEQLLAEGAGPRARGALVLHYERGSDAQKKGIGLLIDVVRYSMFSGYYEAVFEFADRGRALLGADTERTTTYWYFTSMKVQALVALGRTEEAEELCHELQMLTSSANIHMRAAYMLSMIYTRHRTERDHQVAKVWANVAIAIAEGIEDPKKRAFSSVFYQNGLALVELHRGNYEQAMKLVVEGYERLGHELEPHEHRLHRSVLLYNRGQILSRQNRFAEALEVYDEMVEIDPNYPEYHFDHGNIHNLLGHYEEALVSYGNALKVSPPFPEVYFNRGQLYKKLGRLEEALADFNYLLELDPDDVETRVQRGSLFSETGRLQEARQDVEHALTLDGSHAKLLAMLGMIEMEEGRLQEAESAFTLSLQAEGGDVEAWINRAVVRYESGNLPGAIADLTAALSLGENATVLYNRAYVYQAAEDYEQAIRDYTEALLLPEADETDIFYQRGHCYLQTGMETEGLQDWRKHLELAGGASPYQADIAAQAPVLVL